MFLEKESDYEPYSNLEIGEWKHSVFKIPKSKMKYPDIRAILMTQPLMTNNYNCYKDLTTSTQD